MSAFPALILVLLLYDCRSLGRRAQDIAKDPVFAYALPEGEGPAQYAEQRKRYNAILSLLPSLAPAEAKRQWLSLVEQNPGFLEAYLALGRLYFLLEETEALLALYHDLVQQAQFTNERIYKKAEELRKAGRMQESIALMRSLAEFRSAKNFKKCAGLSLKAGKRSASLCYPEPSLWLGAVYLGKAEFEKARKYYGLSLALASTPAHAFAALYALGRLAYLKQNWGESQYYFNLAADYKPSVPKELRVLLAQVYYKQFMIEEALEQCRSILQKEHDYASLKLYGDLLLIQDFRRDLSGLLKLAPNHAVRASLLRHWYGTEDLRYLLHIHDLFRFLY